MFTSWEMSDVMRDVLRSSVLLETLLEDFELWLLMFICLWEDLFRCSALSEVRRYVDQEDDDYYIMRFSYAEINLDESSCIILSCDHILTLKSMNDHMSISDYYTFFDESDDTDSIVRLKSSSKSFSIVELKNCSMCRCSLRNINRYDHIVRRA